MPEDQSQEVPSGENSNLGQPDAANIEAWLVSYLSETLRMEPTSIDVRRPFVYFGLSSADSVIMAGDLERWLGGHPLSPTLAWDFPTIERLSQHLGALGNEGNSVVQEIQQYDNPEMEQILSEIERLPEDEALRRRSDTAPNLKAGTNG